MPYTYKKFVRFCLLCCCLLLWSAGVWAQYDAPEDVAEEQDTWEQSTFDNSTQQNQEQDNGMQTNGGPDPGRDPAVPIDGGLGFLLAAGVGYGARKMHRSRQARNADTGMSRF